MGWQTYYRPFLEEFAGQALIDHRGPFVGDESRQVEIIDAIAGGSKVFLVSAPAGCGKSRFALELARHIGRVQKSWDVRFVRHDEPALGQELSELLRSKDVVLIVDDAQDCPALVQQLAATCASASEESHISLICLTRPAGRAILTEVLASHFPVGEPREIDLGRPNAKLSKELIDKLIASLSPHHRDAIRRFVADSFFAISLLCSSVARQKNLPQTLSTRNLREFAVRKPLAHAAGVPNSSEKAFRALAVYAACSPVRSGDTVVRESAASQSGLPLSEVETMERRILEAGLFHLDGRGLMRPVPDLVGDLILEETCLNEQGRPSPFGQDLIRALYNTHHESIIRNCADIGRLFAATTRVDFLSDLVLEQADGLTNERRPEALHLLESCAALAERQPGTIVRLVDTLTAKGILRPEPPAGELAEPDSLEARAQVLLVAAAEHDPTIVARSMEYSRKLLSRARSSAAACETLRGNLAPSCQFVVARPLAHSTAVLDVLTSWVASPEADTAELAGSLARGFLPLEMRAQLWEGETRTAVSVSLNPAEDVWKLRDRAVDILVRCSRHAAPAVQFAAADSLQHWAHGYGSLTAGLRERWAPQLDRELDALADSFSKLAASTAHLSVRAAVEHQGWHWWVGEAGLPAQRGGKRILSALLEAKPYSLWKALHDDSLPVFAVSLEDTEEPQQRLERLQGLREPSAERVPQLAKELFDQLDPLYQAPRAWSGLFNTVLSGLPSRPLQKRATVYLAEFVKRHPAEAWSFIDEVSAQGPVGAVLPALLVELRGQDTTRWHAAIQHSMPGTRLFEMQLRALCAADELDDAERTMVSRGLQLDDPAAVHLSAQALLNAAPTALAPGLAAAFAVLPGRPTDERLWELTLDAFARWGEHILSAPEGEEAGPAVRAVSGDLLRLLRTYGSSVSWGKGPHTRRLGKVVAIFAGAIPHTLKSWMRELWSPAVDDSDTELPLSTTRFAQVVQLVSKSPTAGFWQKQFAEWITQEPDLANMGARGLAGLCGLGDATVVALVTRVAQQPTGFALEALGELIRRHSVSIQFVDEAMSLLGQLVATPDVYLLVEKEIISAMAQHGSGRTATLQALESWLHKPDLAPELRETLARGKQAIQSSVAEDLLQGAEPR